MARQLLIMRGMSHERDEKAFASTGVLEEWFVPWRFAAFLALMFVVTFPQVILGLEGFYYQDAGCFGYPIAHYFRECFWRGEIPHWNPLNNCGIPFLAQWNTMILYPLSLFYLLLPMPWSFDVFCLGHLFLAGMGMYYLARRWTENRLAAAVAGALFAFNGLSWYALIWANITAAWGWMPWVVLFTERAWNEGRRTVVLAAMAGALQMLTGGVEVIIVTWLFIAGLWAMEFVIGSAGRLKMVCRAAGVVATVAALSAVQLLPFMELLAQSQRSTGFGRSTMAVLPASGLANYLAPKLHTNVNPQGVQVLNDEVTWIGSYYVGAGCVVLALLAIWRVKERRVRLLGGMAALSVMLAMGSRGGVYEVLHKVFPFLGFMRFPVKFILLTTFTLPLIGAAGLAWLLKAEKIAWSAEWRRTRFLAAACVGAILAIVTWDALHPKAGDDVHGTVRNAVVRILFIGLFMGCVSLLHGEKEPKTQRLLQCALVLLLWLDIRTHAPNLSPTVSSSALAPNMVRDYFNWDQLTRLGSSRACPSREQLVQLIEGGTTNAENDEIGRRLGLLLNLNLLDHVAKVDGFYALELKESIQITKESYLGARPAERFKDFLGVSLVPNPTNAVSWTLRENFLPMLTVGLKPEFASDDDAFNALLSPQFNPGRTVYLPLEAMGQINATNDNRATFLSSRISALRINARVSASAPTMLVVAQSYYPAWKAFVDGKAERLWRANYAFQAVEVPAGVHEITLVYEDKGFLIGMMITFAAAAACAGTWLMWRRDRANEGAV